MNSNVDKVFIEFINEHELIDDDIVSELNRFDQFLKGHKTNNSQLCQDNIKEVSLRKYILDCSSGQSKDRRPLYKCRLCSTKLQIEDEFETIEAKFLRHIQNNHVSASTIIADESQNLFDRQMPTELWIGELEKIKKFNYTHHSKEFMQEIDKILDKDENLTQADNSFSAAPSSHASTSVGTTTPPACSPSKQSNKKKKHTFKQCDICHRTFNDLYNLKIHKMIHANEKPFKCEECDKSFRQRSKLKIHCITHTNKKPFKCEICSKSFRHRNYLTIHKRLHSAENPYKCKYCLEFFHSLHSRRQHTKMVHSDVATLFPCSICKKALMDQCHLTAHMKRHTNQRDYKCMACEKLFLSSSQLREHQRIHSNEKKYQCEICMRHFQRKSNYTQHLKRHADHEL